MTNFKFHDVDTAPAGSKPLLSGIVNSLGFLPRLYAGLAESPTALKVYLDSAAAFGKSSLSPVEQQVVLLTVSVANACEFCVAAHSFIARNMVKVPAAVIAALRDETPLPDQKLQALAVFTRQIVADRGWVAEATVAEFLSHGFTRAQVLDVIVGVSVKTLSNYANHILKTPIDAEFASEAWQAPVAA